VDATPTTPKSKRRRVSSIGSAVPFTLRAPRFKAPNTDDFENATPPSKSEENEEKAANAVTGLIGDLQTAPTIRASGAFATSLKALSFAVVAIAKHFNLDPTNLDNAYIEKHWAQIKHPWEEQTMKETAEREKFLNLVRGWVENA